MITLNIFGDFKVDKVHHFAIGPSLQKYINDADVNVVNFEAPIKNSEAIPIDKSGPNIYQDAEAPSFLESVGFNVVSLANNHSDDFGEDSLRKTKNAFKHALTLGAGDWDEAYQVKYIERGNKKIGFLALTQREFGVLDEKCGKENSIGTAWMMHPWVDELIVEAKKTLDYVFILPHAGIEHEYYPLPELRTLYRHFINMGADGVFASHPHTPQGWEYYKDKPVVYSLGNFCFDFAPGRIHPYWYDGLMASLIIDGDNIKMDIACTHYDDNKGIVDIIDDAKLNEHLKNINQLLKDEKQYLKEVNDYCQRLLPNYYLAFAYSGLFRYGLMKFLKQILRHLCGKIHKPNPVHLINNMRCEVHRWAIIRGLLYHK